MDFKRKRIGVLMGGMSSEREVSLDSGRAILEALRNLGYDACAIEADRGLPWTLLDKGVQIAFIGLHGRFGEDGAVQGLLEMMRIPYTGSGILASALAMDKIASRKIFMHSGLPVPRHIVLEKDGPGEKDPSSFQFSFPMVVKPSQEGSSVGVTIVAEREKLSSALEEAFAYDAKILVEEYISGREIQVGVLEDRALGAIEIVPKTQFYSYEAKYTAGLAEHLLPAPLPEEDYRRVLELGLAAHRVLGCEGATRVDLLYARNPGQGEKFTVLEVNTLPGMTSLSLLPEIARGAGIEFPQLVERVLRGARLRIPARGR